MYAGHAELVSGSILICVFMEHGFNGLGGFSRIYFVSIFNFQFSIFNYLCPALRRAQGPSVNFKLRINNYGCMFLLGHSELVSESQLESRLVR